MAGAPGSLAMAFSTLILFAVVGHVGARKPFPGTREVDEGCRLPVLQESIVQEVNSNPSAGWKAGINARLLNYSYSDFKVLLGVSTEGNNSAAQFPLTLQLSLLQSAQLPPSFDARLAWPQCPTIGTIYDQGHCGSCWAFTTAEVMSDRFCIQLGMQVQISPNDILSCCRNCGSCKGGHPANAWTYTYLEGVVTEQCDPYFDQKGCIHGYGRCRRYPTPACVTTCKGGGQNWNQAKHFFDEPHMLPTDSRQIMAELMKNGPLHASMDVYHDFPHYRSGVYRHVAGKFMGKHAVKVVGWGTSETGEDYWLMANQWNRQWGDDGYFKIARGVNECGIEDMVIGAAASRKTLT